MKLNTRCPDPSPAEWAVLCRTAEDAVADARRTGRARSTFHRYFLEARRALGINGEPPSVELVVGFEGQALYCATLRPDLDDKTNFINVYFREL